jgi:uncharacterized protein (TIGR01777 family)
MKVIITGGTGLIGRALTNELSENGHEVTILSRSLEPVAGLPAKTRVVHWDGKTTTGWGNLVEETDAIVNLAGESVAGNNILSMRWTPERKRKILESRINSGKAVLEAVRTARHKPGIVIQSSAVGYYGSQGAERISENTEAGKDFLASVCQEWEASTRDVEAMGVRWAGIRTGIVLSSKGGALARQILPFKFFVGGPLGSGEQAYPWIHLQDVVGAIRFIIEDPFASGVFNLTAPTMINNKEFSRILGKAMHRPCWIPAPAFAFKLAFGEASTILLDGQYAEPKRLLAIGYPFRFEKPEAAVKNILG